MADNIYTDPKRRQDFVLLFDVSDGNPNGDPDAGNLPRLDPETMQGLVTDVCLKRKVRDYVHLVSQEWPPERRTGMEIYVKHQGILNQEHQRAYDTLGKSPNNPNRETIHDARAWMYQHYYDIRMFGAVMTTRVNCGQVRGPVQLTFARSIDPIVPLDLSITRVAVTNLATAEPRARGRGRPAAAVATLEEETDASKITEMGRKAIVPYGLYRAHGFFSPFLAEDTRATEADLAVFWSALQNMWEHDHSASRGFMTCRGLYVFTHQNGTGNAPAHQLFDLIQVRRKDGVEAPRHFSDYLVEVPRDGVPQGIELTVLVG